MTRAAFLLLLALPLSTAGAPEKMQRNFTVTSFERIRVAGPFDVRVEAGKAPSAHAEADPDTLDGLVISVDGTTLTVRRNVNGWAEAQRGIAPSVAVVTLTTPVLHGALVTGGGKLAVAGPAGQRVDLAVNGAGALAVTGAKADQLLATVIGPGSMTLAGRVARAQLQTNGTGAIDASGLDASDLSIRLDGPGQTRAAARYTANIINTGLGQVEVSGNPACKVSAPAGGPVLCGKRE